VGHAGTHRPLYEFLAYTGLRIGEALGMTSADIDHDNTLVRVHQLTRYREHGPLKTEAAKRESRRVGWEAPPRALARLVLQSAASLRLRRHTGAQPRLPRRRRTVPRHHKRAGISAPGEKLTLHSLRHGFASLLISQGLSVVFVSRQLAHANPNITLGTYAHLYARADRAASARVALDASYAALAETGM
jgi:integrase